MAKSSFEIRMDYDRAIQQANLLSQIAQELRNAANKEFGDCIAEISYNWKGNNAAAYVRKCNTLKSNILKTGEQLDRTADIIRRIAKNTYDAEMRAYRVAIIRKY